MQHPHPPIYFGGESEAALRRVADLGDGWHGFNLTPAATAERLGRLDELLAERGRARGDVDITVSPYQHRADTEALQRYAEAGVEQLVVMVLTRTVDQLERQLDLLAETLVRPAAGL